MSVRVWICRCKHVNPGHLSHCRRCRGFWSCVMVRHEDRVRTPRKLKSDKDKQL